MAGIMRGSFCAIQPFLAQGLTAEDWTAQKGSLCAAEKVSPGPFDWGSRYASGQRQAAPGYEAVAPSFRDGQKPATMQIWFDSNTSMRIRPVLRNGMESRSGRPVVVAAAAEVAACVVARVEGGILEAAARVGAVRAARIR